MPTTIRRAFRDFGSIIVRTTHNQYVFSGLTGNRIRGGNKADIEGLYCYTGDSGATHYISESSLDEVPDAVLDAAQELGTIVTDVDGGWASWDGRPEFSKSYVDISEMEIVE